MSAVHRQLTKIFDDAEEIHLEERKDPGRFFFMRPSGFPYCGLRKLLEAPEFLDEDRLMPLAGAYFTSVGTAAHSAFQKYLGRSGYILGDYVCPVCKNVKKFSTFSMCTECKVPRHYEELELFYRNAVVGHTDGLFRLDPEKGKKSKHYVIDYKTTALYKIRSKSKIKDFPYKSNVAQIKMYVVLLEEQYGIEIEGWILAYLGRDLPLGKRGRHLVVVKMTDEEKRKCKKKLDRWVKVHRKVLKIKAVGKKLDYVKKHKLCKSFRHYKDEVMDEYKPCTVSNVCFDEKLLDKYIEKRLKHRVYPIIQHAPKKIRKMLETGDE
jgi:hypothetical protein